MTAVDGVFRSKPRPAHVGGGPFPVWDVADGCVPGELQGRQRMSYEQVVDCPACHLRWLDYTAHKARCTGVPYRIPEPEEAA